MANKIPGYHSVLLEVDLTNRRTNQVPLSPDDTANFVGGRGLGAKLLWDRLRKPGIDALSPENPLMFLAGPLSGFPIPYAARCEIVTKSSLTSPKESKYPHASTIGFSSIGGFFGPEIRFAGYDGIIVTGKADSPVYIAIEDDRVEIRDARKYWGMMTYPCEKQLIEDLGNRKFEILSIGPAAENQVRYSAVLHTLGRASGRGGAGCVMGSKNLKAIAVRGTRMPQVADHKMFLSVLEKIRESIGNNNEPRRYGTASGVTSMSDSGRQAVKNYREGTFLESYNIGGIVAEQAIWVRDIACYCCPQACKKIGVNREGKWSKWVVEGPEYETGTMLGTNLMINDMNGMMMLIGDADDYGYDQISVGNVIGFLMECYEKGLIDKKFTDGIDLTWGNVQAASDVMRNIVYRKGNLGEVAAYGVKHLSEVIGKGSEAFAIHCKGQEYAAHNVQANPPRGLCYITCSRGACHLNGSNVSSQNSKAMTDSTTHCSFGGRTFGETGLTDFLQAITGNPWNAESYAQAGERIYNLEKCFNYREGFTRDDDVLPERFYTEPLTVGPQKGAVVNREEFRKLMDDYYAERDWDQKTSRPSQKKLVSLGLGFAWEGIQNI